ncbi:hypothetical protein B0H66DRAFT_504724, partial [Apodospora peruviana]
MSRQIVLKNAERDKQSVNAHFEADNKAKKKQPRSNIGSSDDEFEGLTVLDRDQTMADIKMDTREELDTGGNVLFIEYMSRGRFDNYLCQTAIYRSDAFPTKVLWQIFDCLFRGIVGLAYPHAFQPPGSNPQTDVIAQVSETSAGLPVLTSYCPHETIIHFDIDPLNILVGDFDSNEHNISPIIKLADYGPVKVFSGRTTPRDAFQSWKVRSHGKTGPKPPEQFSEEWDYVNSTPQAAYQQTAGNYSWWTNLYQIALVMWSAITLCHVEYPPVAEEFNIDHPEGTTTKEWGYGDYLFDQKFSHIDHELRNVVALCLNYNPTRRPAMQMIEATIAKHLTPSPEDRFAQVWAARRFDGPSPPPPPKAE